MAGVTSLFMVILGGALGAGLRAVLSGWLSGRMAAHRAILCINLSGSFLAGALLGALEASAGSEPPLTDTLWLMGAVGVLGGYTTVSTFALQVLSLGRQARDYLAWSVLGCPVAAALGWFLIRWLA